MKRLKQLLIGLALSLLLVPLIKNNVYAYSETITNGSVVNLANCNGVGVKATYSIPNWDRYSPVEVKLTVTSQSTGAVLLTDKKTIYSQYYGGTESCRLYIDLSGYTSGQAKITYSFVCTDPDDYSEANFSEFYAYYQDAPTFTTGGTLTAVNLAYNGTVTKQYSVSANGASSYTWYLDGSPNPTGANGAVYTANIANLSHGNHTLKCVANGAGGTTSSTNQITFNVNKTPVISSGNLM